jgi:hypothetical protein
MTEERMLIHAQGREAKRMLYAPRGTLEMRDSRGLFTKTAHALPGASYPLGTNVAVYLAPGAFMVELETMSPQLTIVPGADATHVERWSLR